MWRSENNRYVEGGWKENNRNEKEAEGKQWKCGEGGGGRKHNKIEEEEEEEEEQEEEKTIKMMMRRRRENSKNCGKVKQ